MPKSKKINLLELLTKREGKYVGIGINHEKKEFKGLLEVKSVVNHKGVSFRYKAIGMEGTEFNKDTVLYNEETVLYNEEYTIICNDSENKLALWTLASRRSTPNATTAAHHATQPKAAAAERSRGQAA